MSAPSQPVPQRGIVKQIVSGDTIDIRRAPKGGPPPTRRIGLSGITAPKLARKAAVNSDAADTKDEPFAWEAREFLRKKLIGKEVCFVVEYKATTGASSKEYCTVYLGKDTNGENIIESIVAEGLVECRRQGKANEQLQRLWELEDNAKAAGKGKWGQGAQDHVRDIKWTIENPRNFIDSFHQQPIKAIVEHVRDGSTLRVLLLPDHYVITLMISGIRCPAMKTEPPHEPYAEEAQYFTESRLLQREVEVILESVSNQNFLGSVLHPNGNIAELLLKEGFARCVDWSMASVSTGAEKLRAAERAAKEKRLRIWKEYTPSGSNIEAKDKEFQGKVMEVVNADALVIKTTEGDIKKIFLSSIKPPKISEEKQTEIQKDSKGRNFRPLYDIPYMYEAREFLRKKLVGKKVNVQVDYVQPASQSFPEKTCCTVTIGGINVAEALVSKGLATVVRYRQDDDHRSMRYDELLAAEMKAQKSGKGLHNKKETPVHRVVDLSGDLSKSKQFLPFLKRAEQMDAVVEFVASGSRLRLFIPRENCLVTFLLAGINCPKAPRQVPGGTTIEGEPWGEEALKFTKELCLQREVKVEVESMDRVGNFIGWLWVEGANLSVALVQEGLASVHFTAERSTHARALQIAEDGAKQKKEKIWSNYEEQKEVDPKDELVERKINHETVVVTEVRPDLTFYVQYTKDGKRLEEAMQQLRQELTSNPPLPGSYTPKKGDLCAAKFEDDQWYRAKVEKIAGSLVHIFYVDFGNREVTQASKLAVLPSTYHMLSYAAHEYGLACVTAPQEPELAEEARLEFMQDVENKVLLLNIEYKVGGVEYVTLLSGDNKDDIAKGLISDGLLLAENRKEKRLQKLVSEYKSAQDAAKRKRLNLWQYGDFTEDDAKEFGYKP